MKIVQYLTLFPSITGDFPFSYDLIKTSFVSKEPIREILTIAYWDIIR